MIQTWRNFNWTWYIGFFILALLIRVLFVVSVDVKPTAGGDPRVYDETARNILEKGIAYSEEGYAFRSPLYSYFVAAVYLVSGQTQKNVFLAQAVLGAFGAILLFQSLRYLGPSVSMVGTLLYSIHPALLFYTSQLLTESLYTFILILMTCSTFQFLVGKMRWMWVMGFAMGMAVLCRSEGIVVSFLCLLVVVNSRHFPKYIRVRAIAVAVLVAGLVMLPWLIRNYLLLGAPVLSTEGGLTFYLGNNPEATGGYFLPSHQLPNIPSGEVDRSNFYFRNGWTFIRSNPMAFLDLGLKKQISLWSPNHNLVLDGADIILIPFAVLGLMLAVRERSKWQFYCLLASPILTVMLVSSVVIGQVRFRTSLYPYIVSFATIALVFVFDRVASLVSKWASLHSFSC